MKKLITICLLSITIFTVNAQADFLGTLSYRTTPENSWDGIDASFNIGLKGSTSDGGVAFYETVYNVTINSIKIRQREIPVSEIPANVLAKLKNNIRVSSMSFDLFVNSSYVKKMSQRSNIGWAQLQGLANSEGYKQSVKDNGYKLFHNGAISIQNATITGVHYMIDDTYRKNIEIEISGGNKKTTSSNSKTSNDKVTELGLVMSSSDSSTNSDESINSTSETEVTTEDGGNSAANYISSNYASPTKTEVYVQAAATVVGGLVDNWNANYERKMAKMAAESSAASERARQKEIDKFESVYLPLMDLANGGDEDARMILYFTSKIFRLESSVPSRERWFEKALTNNNQDALAEKVKSLLYAEKVYESVIPYMEEIANTGNVDVMMMLASWYDLSSDSNAKGGNDSKKALEFFKMAAEKGSPNAMYKLGMIYKYGRTPDISGGHGFLKKWHVMYDIVPDEKIAFDWFKKSLLPRYKESIFAKSVTGSRDFGLSRDPSYFERKTFLELAYIYRKGKVVPKDKDLAIELEGMYSGYVNKQTFDYISKK